MGYSLRLLTDQGKNFVGKLMQELSNLMGIENCQTTVYHPQCNGHIERVHSTLNSMLTKVAKKGLDWAQHLPWALYCLRCMVNRDTGYSAAELLMGRNLRTPLDLLHAGWAQTELRNMHVSAYVETLRGHLESSHENAAANEVIPQFNRACQYNQGKAERKIDVNEKILVRTPGLVAKLEESWTGPWVVAEKLSRVNVRVALCENMRKKRVVHLNNLKRYYDRDSLVSQVTVVNKEEDIPESSGPLLSGECPVGG